MISGIFVALLAVTLGVLAAAGPSPAYVCSFCQGVLGIAEEAAIQVHLENVLSSKCPADSLICHRAVKELILSLTSKVNPHDLCVEMNACPSECKLFSSWPVNPLPDAPPAWPIERRLMSEDIKSSPEKSFIHEDVMAMNIPRKLDILKPIFEAFVPSWVPQGWGMWAPVSFALAEFKALMHNEYNATAIPPIGVKADPCGFNITCKIEHIGDHKPLQDFDGDYFSMQGVRRLRGNDWRGYDCDDLRGDVYPGRKTSHHGNAVDHNCNGISGGNSTGSYEELFCANSQPRGIAILGDSATAHFHIPPQWVTAQNWNVNQLMPDAENELDFPHCSWGTGHADPTLCPMQHPIPGVEGPIVTSLYSQLRARNRCNHNDFQNIGVNGARMTSSAQLVDAFARDPAHDHPMLLWLALIGNDICNGHPTFDHMTKPDDFYTHAMETLNRLDTMLPANSYVVSLALFDGELLYSTMHNKVHPLGTKYSQLYDFMNCLEENPCWGWLNSNATVRAISTYKSTQLNNVYQNISDNQSFKNFKYIFFNPKWTDIFDEYVQTGRPLTDLIEPTDGFHPSQTGNAMFGKKFFEFLDQNYPDALGPINPYNAEIDAMFFSSPQANKALHA